MRRLGAAVLLLVLAACSSGAPSRSNLLGPKPTGTPPDQGTVDICTSIVGFAIPDITAQNSGLGPITAWYRVAHAAVEKAKDARVKTAAAEVARTTDPKLQKRGLSDAEVREYADAATRFQAACKDANAYAGTAKHLYQRSRPI